MADVMAIPGGADLLALRKRLRTLADGVGVDHDAYAADVGLHEDTRLAWGAVAAPSAARKAAMVRAWASRASNKAVARYAEAVAAAGTEAPKGLAVATDAAYSAIRMREQAAEAKAAAAEVATMAAEAKKAAKAARAARKAEEKEAAKAEKASRRKSSEGATPGSASRRKSGGGTPGSGKRRRQAQRAEMAWAGEAADEDEPAAMDADAPGDGEDAASEGGGSGEDEAALAAPPKRRKRAERAKSRAPRKSKAKVAAKAAEEEEEEEAEAEQESPDVWDLPDTVPAADDEEGEGVDEEGGSDEDDEGEGEGEDEEAGLTDASVAKATEGVLNTLSEDEVEQLGIKALKKLVAQEMGVGKDDLRPFKQVMHEAFEDFFAVHLTQTQTQAQATQESE